MNRIRASDAEYRKDCSKISQTILNYFDYLKAMKGYLYEMYRVNKKSNNTV